MDLNIKIKFALSEAFTAYDRLRTADEILKSIKGYIQKNEGKNVKLVSIKGEIEKE